LPLFPLALFVVWFMLIIAVAWVVERTPESSHDPAQH
jgi:hypothetical protein